MAEPTDRWSTGALQPVGASLTNTSRILGHEVDVSLVIAPWDAVQFGAGYGMFILGEGGKTILDEAGRGSHSLLHFTYLQARLQAP